MYIGKSNMDFKIDMRNSLILELNSLCDSESDIVFERFEETEHYKVYEVLVKVSFSENRFRMYKYTYSVSSRNYSLNIVTLDKDIVRVISNIQNEK